MKKAVKYDPIFCEELIEHCKNGYTIEQFASKIGCSKASIYNWKDKHEDFADAHEKGKAQLQMRVLKRLHDFAEGIMPRNASVVAAIFLAKNLGIRDDVVEEKFGDNAITLAYKQITDPDEKK